MNNIAIAARHAQVVYGLKRVLIVDFDVHHGNGTEDIFYADPDVLFISTHQYPFYPGTGAIHDTGDGQGVGATINIPLKSGHGDSSYKAIFDQIVVPAAHRFKPDIILVSAGFDAHFVDPLAMMRLSHTGYTALARSLKALADTLCEGKIIFVMEGGYDVQALAEGMQNIAHVLLDEDLIADSFGNAPGQEPDVLPLINQLATIHSL